MAHTGTTSSATTVAGMTAAMTTSTTDDHQQASMDYQSRVLGFSASPSSSTSGRNESDSNNNNNNINDSGSGSDHEDVNDASRCKQVCFQVSRVMILLLGLIAIAFSVLTILSCSFFEHRNNINNGLPASNTEMTATLTPQEEGGAIFGVDVSGIGLFSFELNSDETNFSIVDTETETDTAIGLGFDEIEFDDLTGETCQPYEGRFISPAPWMDTVWIVAQFASIIAPCLGGVAFLFIFLETTIGPFRGSFLAPILLLITSSFVQGCTFLTLAQKDVCFANDDINTSSGSNGSTFVGTGLSPSSSSYCRLSYGAFMSISASFIYYLVSVGLCCFPRPKSSLCCCFTKSSSSRTIISGDGKNDPRRRPQSSSSSSSSDHNRHSEEVVDTTDEEDPTPPPRCRSSSSNDNSGNRNEEDDEVADRRGEIGANQHQRRYIWQELY